ncbi:hypothetical protein So717_02260 [Roseobacter cerasinus]|uniref:Uncharacterized protein n=1 Tax=Roseobacter cerasinus TaxID=2602289 RepID=A0A640VJE9_9RHOB|nr:hypothetical protein [Roseobacter cerasinus]GFE48473.1 hypothetical protein So717_02260 [Roseobacter cerasinus]
MLDNLHNLDLTAKDLELIESALHTQKKILTVQSHAGGSGARQRLTDLKHLMKRINRSTARPQRASRQSWGQFARMLFCTQCDEVR